LLALPFLYECLGFGASSKQPSQVFVLNHKHHFTALPALIIVSPSRPRQGNLFEARIFEADAVRIARALADGLIQEVIDEDDRNET